MMLHNITSEEEYYKDQQIRLRISSLKQGAKDRLLEWNITDEKARELINSNCYYCNTEPLVGIDRIDSSKGYTIDNVVPCCGTCNIMKNAFSQETFLEQIHKIYNNRLKSSSTTIPKGSTPEANAGGNVEHPAKDGDIV